MPWISQAQGYQVQDSVSIQQEAETFALSNLADKGYLELTAQAASLDSRLKLRQCELPLETFSTSPQAKAGRTTVGVKCTGAAPWTLYVPVNVSAISAVVMIQGPLKRGTIISAQDLQIQSRDLQHLPPNYLQEPEAVLGMELTRPVSQDTVLTLSMVRERELINKGQEVVIMASGNNFQVRMNGTALQNGRAGQRITVRNKNSGRTIQAVVRDAATVEVAL